MIEASISVGDPEELILLLGTKDQHLRQIRNAIPAKIATRDDKIVIQGDEDAVIKASAVLEQLRVVIGRIGSAEAEHVAQLIHGVTGGEASPVPLHIDVRNGRK
ncbi:MAG: hypothetical protein AAF961_17600, partial [Planctomycetota bacterium]